ncbi:MAG TPA: hypothetical protein VH583_21410 [Vicinamibacterales bacterium]|jgi:hypothetical protein
MADQHHLAHAGVGQPSHHEESDVNIRGILTFAAGLVVALIVISGIVGLLFRALDVREARQQTPQFPLAGTEEHRLPPEPRLQTNPREDLQELRDAEQQTLTTYGWVDRNAGVVRIPIDEAMKLAIQRGLPARGATR